MPENHPEVNQIINLSPSATPTATNNYPNTHADLTP
jgi:hypothetical protein